MSQFATIHLVQLVPPLGPEFSQFKPYVWLVRDNCPSQGIFVGECQDALDAFARDHFKGWDLSLPWRIDQLGAFNLVVGKGKGFEFLPGMSRQFSLFGLTRYSIHDKIMEVTSELF